MPCSRRPIISMLRRNFSGKYIKKAHRMFKSLAVAVLFTVTVPSASAIYKCGSTYSQTPCSPDAKEIEIHSGQASGSSPTPKTSQGQIEQNIKLCERALREIPDWKDRETLKISPIKRALTTMNVDIKGQKRDVTPYISNHYCPVKTRTKSIG